MKLALLGFVALACGVAVGVMLMLAGAGSGESDVAALERGLAAIRADARALADRVAGLERGLARIDHAEPARGEVARLPSVERLPATEAAPPGAPARAALDPRRLLAEYVASFENGGAGSDFFRMAVAAYAWQLRRELQAIVADRDAPDALRRQVMAMFDGGSFRGDGDTIDALLAVVRQGGWEQGTIEALAMLAKIGDRRTAELIERLASGLEPLRARVAAWSAIVQLCGGDADSVLLRLFEREHDPEGRMQMIALFRGADLAATLRAFEIASRMEKGVRLAAAGRVGRFRDERFGVLIDDWIARETDEEVRARLIAAQAQRRQVPGWHELQATGPPNVEQAGSDDPRAWAPASADGGREWIELTWAKPLRANRVTVFETCTAGGVVSVDLEEEGSGWRTVWSGDDPLSAPGPFEVRFATTHRPVRKVRVTLDTRRRPGWDEIDAVELSGPDGAAWAAQAAASSRYGERAADPMLAGSEQLRAPMEWLETVLRPEFDRR